MSASGPNWSARQSAALITVLLLLVIAFYVIVDAWLSAQGL